MKTTGFVLHVDPGHAWLQVPVKLLKELGFIGKITQYSYVDNTNTFAYLEEDCDYGTFVEAYGVGKYQSEPTVEFLYDNDAPIRRMKRFSGTNIRFR